MSDFEVCLSIVALAIRYPVYQFHKIDHISKKNSIPRADGRAGIVASYCGTDGPH